MRNQLRAFTLVELLVVIAIIGILAGLVLAAVGGVRVKGLTTRSMGNIRSLAQANLAYAAEHGRYCPADDQFNQRRWHGARGGSKQPFDPAAGFLAPYLGGEGRVAQCPLFQEMLKGAQSFEEGSGGYGYNAVYIGGRPVMDPAQQYDAQGVRIPETPVNVPQPGRTVMFTSTAYARAGGLQEYPFAEPPFWDFGEGPAGFRPSPSVHFRFNGKALAVWCDGRASLEERQLRAEGENPHGGNPLAQELGWFGPDEGNGYWNPAAP